MSVQAKEREEFERKLQEYAGVDIGPPDVGRDAVNEAMVRQWCDAMGDENPAYVDAEGAVKTVHGGLVAPPTMLQAWILPGVEMAEQDAPPKDEQQRLHKLFNDNGYTGVVATDCEQGYSRYLKPGDRVVATTTIETISEQKATALGTGYFINTRTVFRDQAGEEVGWMTFRVLKFIPANPPAAVSDDAGAAAAPKPTRMRPPKGFDNAWWWDVVDKGEIPIQKCGDCGALHHPPRPMCNQCQGTSMDWVPACGVGKVYTYTIMHHPQFPGFEYPFIAALVELEEGTRLVSNVVDVAPEDMYIGMPVEAFVEQVDDEMKMPLFRPAAGAVKR